MHTNVHILFYLIKSGEGVFQSIVFSSLFLVMQTCNLKDRGCVHREIGTLYRTCVYCDFRNEQTHARDAKSPFYCNNENSFKQFTQLILKLFTL